MIRFSFRHVRQSLHGGGNSPGFTPAQASPHNPYWEEETARVLPRRKPRPFQNWMSLRQMPMISRATTGHSQGITRHLSGAISNRGRNTPGFTPAHASPLSKLDVLPSRHQIPMISRATTGNSQGITRHLSSIRYQCSVEPPPAETRG